MAQPTEAQIEKILSQILSSPEFNDSKRYQELLKYIVEKSSKVSSLKETELAHDLFGKDASFDPSADPLIRSYVSNLRKKLEHYYLTTETVYDYRIEIPKGHYIVKYIPVEQKQEVKTGIPKKSWIYIPIIIILCTVIVVREFMHQDARVQTKNSFEKSFIWSDFLKQDGHPVLIVIGDYLLLSEKNKPNRRTFFRMPHINSEKEFNDSLQINPKKFKDLEISDVTFVGAAPALGIGKLMEVFEGSNKTTSTKLSHELKWDDFENHDVIFIGSLKNLYKLDTLFSRTNIRYDLNSIPNFLKIIDGKNGTNNSFDINWQGGNYQKDYSVILKLHNSKNNTILFLTGFSELGVMDAIKSSLDPNLINRISKFSGRSMPGSFLNFELISEVEGLKYTVFGSQIKYVQPF